MKLKIRRLLLIVFVGLFATGCAQLPRSSAVHSFAPPSEETATLIQSARGPVKDSAPETLIRDFLRACAAGNFDDYAKAKLFLTEEALKQWNPQASINVIRSGSGPNIQFNDGEATIKADLDSTVEQNGVRLLAARDQQLRQDMSLIKNADGQWRINRLEQGIVIPASTFETAFAPRPLYFLTPDLEDLVPDVRWYSRRDLPVELVQGLLGGPSSQIAEGVRSFVPKDTRLLTNSVDIDSGRAVVTLSEQVMSLSESERVQLYRQFARTLTGVAQINQVQLQSANTFIGGDKEPASVSPYDVTSLTGIDEQGDLVTINQNSRPQLRFPHYQESGLAGAVSAPKNPDLIACRKGTNKLVLIGADEGEQREIFTKNDIVDPSIDRREWVWTASQNYSHEVFAVKENVGHLAIPLEGIDNFPSAQITGIRISLDGARAAISTSGIDSAQVVVFVVKRDEQGTPLALVKPQQMPISAHTVTSLAWVNQSTLAALGETSLGNKQLWQMQVGGVVEFLSPPMSASNLAGGSSSGQVTISDKDGKIYNRVGGSWRLSSQRLVDARYAG